MKIKKEHIERIDEVLSRGLCNGVGSQNGQMCVEAAVCYALGEPHGDSPSCTSPAVREFKIALNDKNWSSPEARAKGMRSLAIAQLGTRGVVDCQEFTKLLSEKTIRVLIPTLFRELFPNNKELLSAADRCEKKGTREAATFAASVATSTASVAASAAAASAAAAVAAATYAAYAAYAASAAAHIASDKYLLLSAQLALEVLQELGSPGCEWL